MTVLWLVVGSWTAVCLSGWAFLVVAYRATYLPAADHRGAVPAAVEPVTSAGPPSAVAVPDALPV